MLQQMPPDECTREALRQAAAALDSAEERDLPIARSRALARVAACHRDLGVLASAEMHYRAALRWARAAGSTDQVVELLCELAETALRIAGTRQKNRRGRAGHAALDRARDCAFEASMLAGRVADRGWEATVLLRVSDLLARCGDRDDAALLQRRAGWVATDATERRRSARA